MARMENWTAFNDKVPGDTIALVLTTAAFVADTPERLAEGVIVKATNTTRTFTMEGAIRYGEVRYRRNWRDPQEDAGIAGIDGLRYRFRVATPSDIARITDPNRARRDALEEAMRDIRHYRSRTTKEEVAALTDGLKAALAAAEKLHAAL